MFSRLVVEHEEITSRHSHVGKHKLSRTQLLAIAGLMIIVAAASLAAYVWWPDIRSVLGASSEPFKASSMKRLTTSGNATYGAMSR
jgi:hypothetical protein